MTWLSNESFGLTIKLEGELLGAWVDAVRAACAHREPQCLDLAAVTYADTAGVQLLRELMADGVEIAACSSFVRALLHQVS